MSRQSESSHQIENRDSLATRVICVELDPPLAATEIQKLTWQDLIKDLSKSPQVVILDWGWCLSNESSIRQWLTKVSTQPILVLHMGTVDSSNSLKTDLLNQLRPQSILRSWTSEAIDSAILHATERLREKAQSESLRSLVEQQRKRLQELYHELEERISKRQEFLIEARRRSHAAGVKWETIREASLAVFEADSIHELEERLLRTLSPIISIRNLLISPKSQAESENKLAGPTKRQTEVQDHVAWSLELHRSDSDSSSLGSITFTREKSEKTFSREDKEFLSRIRELVTLAVDRLVRRHEVEQLGAQWAATFNSITDPVMLVDLNYQILQANSALLENSVHTDGPCYLRLFGRKKPCVGCDLNNHLEVNELGKNWKVQSQRLKSHEGLFFHRYTDVTRQNLLERQLRDQRESAELGSIGSSIAHELNNPLAGILSFVQLARQEHSTDSELQLDLKEMEKAVRRCQEIIQRVLLESREIFRS